MTKKEIVDLLLIALEKTEKNMQVQKEGLLEAFDNNDVNAVNHYNIKFNCERAKYDLLSEIINHINFVEGKI